MIRGRVGADVYSIGKDSKGSRQQIVRSLAEQVANPRTTSQMRGRMIMSTVMQAVSGLSALVDHSFDGFPNGQPSISEFIRVNYGLVKADVTAHPSTGNSFGLNLYGEKGVKGGKWVIASGKAILPAALQFDTEAANKVNISIASATPTVADVKSALGFGSEDYFTGVMIMADGTAQFFRVSVSDSAADATAITADNAASLFSISGTGSVQVSLSVSGSNATVGFTFSSAVDVLANGIIVSVKRDANFSHNNAVMNIVITPTATAAVALPSYPTGVERYLNGGDLDGLVMNSTPGNVSGGSGSGGSGSGDNDGPSAGGGDEEG